MSKLIPVLVRAFGRSGTTLMMQLLGSSALFVLERRYPYEDRYLSYIYRLSNVVDKGVPNAGGLRWGDHEVNVSGSPIVGGLPYVPATIVDLDRLKDRFFQGMWDQFSACVYERLATTDREGESPVYYAEKISLQIADDVNRFLPESKNICLVRDPRAELHSKMEFNKKRGFLAFGWDREDTAYTYASRMIDSRIRFFNLLSRYYKSKSKEYLVIRYEDLVENLESETNEIGKWLGVELDHDEVMANRRKLAHHITSDSYKESVDGWQEKLDEDVKSLFMERMGNELKSFGYSSGRK
jgi:hypothetical protein